ncbi:MAG: hypothetical protein HEQ25_02200 [Dolichospermum sp. DET73]|nr:hypothetical protein [Dolichospermum sp. DET73]
MSDRFWECGVRSRLGMLGVRSLFGDVGSAIAQALTCQFAVWDVGSVIAVWGCWECDSEALLQAVRCLGMLI